MTILALDRLDDKIDMECDSSLFFKLPKPHQVIVELILGLGLDLNKIKILDVACGHNFPIIKWFSDNNSGPVLSGYLASQGANVIGIDQWSYKKSKGFNSDNLILKSGMAQRISKYFSENSFDLVISSAYFGCPSSRGERDFSSAREYSIMKQIFDVTKHGGYGIHFLIDEYWQLDNIDLNRIGYNVKSGLRKDLVLDNLKNSTEILKKIVLLQKSF